MNKRQKKKALRKRLMSMNMKFMPLITKNHRVYDLNKMADVFEGMLERGKARVTGAQIGQTFRADGAMPYYMGDIHEPSFSIGSLDDRIVHIDQMLSFAERRKRLQQENTFIIKKSDIMPNLEGSFRIIESANYGKIVLDSLNLDQEDEDIRFSPDSQHCINKPKKE